MRNRLVAPLFGCALSLFLLATISPAPALADADAAPSPRPFVRAPLSFEPNEGQTRADIQYSAYASGYAVQFEGSGIRLVYAAYPNQSLADHLKSQFIARWTGQAADNQAAARTIGIEFVHARSSLRWQGEGALAGRSNYFRGSDPARWHRQIPHYARVGAQGVYPGIDVTFYDTAGKLEYDFDVAAGADPGRIRLRASGASAPHLAGDGALEWNSDRGAMRLEPPVAYQTQGGERHLVAATYTLRGREVGLSLGAYDRTVPLTIDPVLDFAALVGGGGYGTWPFGMAIDASGNTYISGFTCSENYPSTPGSAYTRGGANIAFVDACDVAFVTKLSADGSTLVYSTFLGGSLYNFGSRLAVDAAGEVYVTGGTSSTDFPVTEGAYQTTYQSGSSPYAASCVAGLTPCGDAFVVKLSADGSQLLYSTYIGQSDINCATAIAIDSAGAAYVTGGTNSASFPVTASAPQKTFEGGNTCFGLSLPCLNAFAAKLSADGSQLLYATYMGGSEQTMGQAIAVDASGEAFIGGSTAAANFPTTTGALQATAAYTYDGQYHGFVTKLSANGSQFLYSTYLGGSGSEYLIDLKLNSAGNAYLTGATTSPNFPVTAGVYQTTYGGSPSFLVSPTSPSGCVANLSVTQPCGDVFVAELNSAGSGLLLSTYLGGQGGDSATSLSLDAAQDIWLTGATSTPCQGSCPSGTVYFPTTSNAYYPTLAPTNYEGFLVELNPSAKQLLYSTFVMPTQASTGTAVSAASNGDIYLLGQVLYPSAGEPVTTYNAFNADPGGGAFVMRWSPGGAAPAVLLNPTTLSFASTTVDASTPSQPITLTNVGTGVLNFGLSLEQGINSTFAQSSNCTGTLAANVSCTINVSFAPTSVAAAAAGANLNPGSLSDTLVVTSNAPGANDVTLAGTVNDPLGVAFVPASLTFGTQAAGSTPASSFSQTSNLVEQSAVNVQGGSAPDVTSVTVGGVNPGDFTVNVGGCAVGSTSGCDITASFTPAVSATGTRSATVTVGSSAPGAPFVLNLTGTVASGPALQFYPQSVDSGTQTVGVLFSNVSAVYLWNTGSSALTVTGYSFGTDYVLDGVGGGNGNCSALPIQLAAQGSCEILFQFEPTVVGNRNTTVTFASNSLGTPAVLSLLGSGAPASGPRLSLSPHSYQFGSVQVGTTLNAPEYIGLGNNGTSALTYTLSYTGDFVAPPAGSAGSCGSPLAAAGFCYLGVTFAPSTSGVRNGGVTITSNAPDSPSVVALSGTGVLLPTLTFTPAAVNFGPTAINVVGPAVNVIASNSGNGPLTLSAASVTGPFVLQHNGCTAAVAPGGSCTISVSADPVAAGIASGTLLVTNNTVVGHQTPVALSAFGTTGPALLLSATALNFGNQPVLTQSAPQTVTVNSTGSAAASLAGVVANGDYVQTNNCPSSLAPGVSCTVSVSFLPSVNSANTIPAALIGNLEIGGNFSGSPALVRLTGIGTAATAAASVTGLTVLPNPASAGQSVSITAHVTSSIAGTPSGSVNFYDGDQFIGSVALGAQQSAALSVTPATGGAHSIKAVYGGNGTYAGSASSILSLQVGSSSSGSSSSGGGGTPDFSIADYPGSQTVSPGHPAQTTLTLTPLNGFDQTVALSCSGLPTGAQCQFSPASVLLNGAAMSPTLTITTTANMAMNFRGRGVDPLMPGGLLLAGVGLLPLVLRRRRTPPRRWARRAWVAVLGLGAVALLQASSSGGSNGTAGGGSSGGGSGGTPAGTYAVIITGTGSSATHTAQFTLTVS